MQNKSFFPLVIKNFSLFKIFLDNFVSISKEFINNIKVCAAFLYINHFVISKKPPEKLNILIRPLLASLSIEKYTFFVERTSFSLFHLTNLFENKNPSPMPKVLKNVISSLHDLKKQQSYYKNIKIKQGNTELYSNKAQGVNNFMNLLIEKHKDQTFVKYPCLIENLTNEIDVLEKLANEGANVDEILKKGNFEVVFQNLKSLKYLLSSSFLNESLLKIFEKIMNKLIKSLQLIHLIESNLDLDFSKDFPNESEVFNESNKGNPNFKGIHSKIIKTCKNVIFSLSQRISAQKNSVKENKNSYEEFFLNIIEKIYFLLKDENLLTYELVSSSLIFILVEKNYCRHVYGL